jgi:PHP domain
MAEPALRHKSYQGFPFAELCGALHLHTTCSDGGVTFPEMIQAAQDVGLDYIVVTDHMNLAGRESGYEGFNGTVFVCVGYEHNDANNKNHYLVMGTDKVVDYIDEPQGYIDRIKAAGGIGFLAHPIEKRHYFEAYPPYPWTNWNATGFDGIELWNQMSDWLENLRSRFHFMRLFYPRRFLVEIRKELLQRWDEMNRTRLVSGVGGVDAHSMKIKLGIVPLTVFPVKVELKGIRTHLYLSRPLPPTDAKQAKALMLEALKKGRGFISNYRRSDAKGTVLSLEYGNGRVACPGLPDEEIAVPACIRVRLPRRAEIRCIRNGSCIDIRNGEAGDFDVVSKGSYRIEAWLGKHAWIYSNPFPVGGYPLW